MYHLFCIEGGVEGLNLVESDGVVGVATGVGRQVLDWRLGLMWMECGSHEEV